MTLLDTTKSCQNIWMVSGRREQILCPPLLQVALLIQIGKEAMPPEIVPMILTTRDRKELAKYTLPAPPHGLSLVAVKYNEDHLRLPPDGSPRISVGRHRSVTKCKLPLY